MAKLSRIVAKIFGSGAGIDQISVFGSLFAGSAAFTTDPLTAQSLSNWLTGWNGAAIGGNSPAIEDMNAAFFVHSYQIAYLLQQGVPEWDASTTYYIGNIVSASGILYVSLTDNNLNNAVTSLSDWKNVTSLNNVSTKTANYTITSNDSFLVGNAGSGAFQFDLPDSATNPGKILYFKKIDSSSNAITIARSGSDTIDGGASIDMLSQYESITLISNGGGLWAIF